MKIGEDIWKTIQKHLNYNDKEMKIFRANPRNEDVLSKTALILYFRLTFGCSGHARLS
ncbi:MAG: hypothetical protein ABSF79_02390 [Smithellaceae bacterium]|jgi:hypothetical protein